jgi:EmrB/QacA subfamily drug resistance transporter
MAGLRQRLERTPPGYTYSIGRILAIYGGLMVAMMLASLDQTIMATALPSVASDLGGISSYAWVFASYLLCSTVTVPIYGKLSDVHGSRRLIMVAIVIFLVGSALCGAAQNMTQLAVFRGIQGLGAGGLIPLGMSTISVLVPPRDRGRYQGIISANFGASSILGPAIGGLIVDNTSWRWIFYVNLPLGAVALGALAVTMPKMAKRRDHSIDYLGAGLLAAGTAAILLGLIWGGRQYPWGSPQVIGALLAGVVVLAAFGLVERRVKETILPFDVLRERTVSASAACIGLGAMCMFGTITFVPVFAQGVIGTSATSSGVVLTPLMLATVCTSILSGQWVSRTGRYRANALLGPVVLGAAMILLSRMTLSTSSGEAARNMIIAGIGMGLMMQVFVVAAQNVVPTDVIGSTTSLLQFSRLVGRTIGVAVFGVIVNQNLPQSVRGVASISHKLNGPAREQLAHALRQPFLFGAVLCVIMLGIVVVGIPERPLRRTFDEPSAMEARAGSPAASPDAGS